MATEPKSHTESDGIPSRKPLAPNSRKDLGDLHRLLLKSCPPSATNPVGSIKSTLAPALGVTHQYIYQWIRDGFVPQKFVKRIVKLSRDQVTVEDLLPYVLPD